MAFFSKKTKEAANKAVPTATKPVSGVRSAGNRAQNVLLNPRITEKATDMHGHGAYVFDVLPRANKRLIVSAIKRAYGVNPKGVRVVSVHAKTRRSARTGKLGVTTGGKKAYVYLKDGDTIAVS